jgi:hypothetical protein
MTAQEVFDAYLSFLWQQLQYDWSWMSSPWILYTVIPEILYLVFFTVKWMVLLAPVTIPIVTAKVAWTNYPPVLKRDESFKNN